MEFVQSLLPTIEHFHIAGYWIAFAAALLETIIGVGLFLPGSTTILFLGTLAGKGYFDLGDLLWFAAVGAIIGDNINYFIGRKYGAKILEKGFWFLEASHFKKGENFFKQYGTKSVFIGRFVPSLKEAIPLIAGIFRMRRSSFMLWNVLGAVGWSFIWVLPGYFFAYSINLAETWATRVSLFLVVIATILIILYSMKFLFTKKLK